MEIYSLELCKVNNDQRKDKEKKEEMGKYV